MEASLPVRSLAVLVRGNLSNELQPYTKVFLNRLPPVNRLAELNRLQKAFPYPPDQDKHRMLVAVALDTNEVIGFVDIDSRPPLQPQYNSK